MNISKDTVKDFTSTVNKNMLKVLNQTVTSTTSGCYADQKLKITVGPGAKLNIVGSMKQELQGRCDLSVVFKDSSKLDLKQIINESVTSTLKQQKEQKTGFFSPGLNVSVSEAELQTHIETLTDKTIDTSFLQKIISDASANQSQELVILGEVTIQGDYGQSLQLQVLVNSVTERMGEVMNNDAIIRSVEKTTDQTTKQETVGVDKVAETAGDVAKTGITTAGDVAKTGISSVAWIIGGIVGLIVLILLFVLIFSFRKGSSQTPAYVQVPMMRPGYT